MNSEFVKHIEKLLYESECVIIPGFGAFVARRQPASLNTSASRIEPRSKFIAFNPALKQNDGSLVTAIASAENIAYPEAQNLLNTWVHQSLQILKEERALEFGAAGNFILGPEDQIIFQPKSNVNFDAESYGLQSLHVSVLHSAIEVPVKEVEVIPAPQVPAEAVLTIAKPKKRRLFAAAAVMTALIGAGIIIGKNTFFDETQFSSLNPLNFDSNVIDKMVEEAEKTEQPADSMSRDLADLANVNPDTSHLPLNDTIYYAVGGAFAYEKNAVKFSKILESKGYEPEMIKEPAYRLIRVSYKSLTSRESADSFLNEIRSKEDPEAWLLALTPKDYQTIQK